MISLKSIYFFGILFISKTSARIPFNPSPHINHVIEDGFEHPNVHYEGFVLSDVFVYQTKSTSTNPNEVSHTLVQRKLQFNKNRHLQLKETSENYLFDNMTEEISSLDASSDLSRLKVRGLAKLNFINAKLNTFFFGFDILNELDSGELQFNASSPEDSRDITTALLEAARREVADIANSINASYEFYDTPNEAARNTTGIACILFKRGSDSILVFRDTASEGDNANVMVLAEPAIVDTKAYYGGTQLLKRNWERAGLEWGPTQIARSKEASWYLETLFPTVLYFIYQLGFADNLSEAVNGQKVGGDGDVVELTVKEARKQGYWPIVKAVVEQVRKDLPPGGRILFSGYSQGGGHAQMSRMYTEKKYGEKWPTVTFGAIGAACYPRDLGGIFRTNYLEDMDPTIMYDNVTNYMLYLDPYGGGLGESIGKTCYLGKYDIDNGQSMQEKYCGEVMGYAYARLLGDEQLGLEPIRTLGKTCRFSTHSFPFIMNELDKDIELNADATTLGGCFEYPGSPLDSGECPADRDGLFERLSRYMEVIPALFVVLYRFLF